MVGFMFLCQLKKIKGRENISSTTGGSWGVVKQQTESSGTERLLSEVRKYIHIARHTQRMTNKVERVSP